MGLLVVLQVILVDCKKDKPCRTTNKTNQNKT